MARWRIGLVVVCFVSLAPLALIHCSKEEAAPAPADAGVDAPVAPVEDAASTVDGPNPIDAPTDTAQCQPPPTLAATCFDTAGSVYCLDNSSKCSAAPGTDCPNALTLDCTTNADCARFGNPDLAYCCVAGRPPETPPPANCSTPRIVPQAVTGTSASFCATLGDCVNTPRGNYACKENADCPNGTCQLHAIVGTGVGIGICK